MGGILFSTASLLIKIKILYFNINCTCYLLELHAFKWYGVTILALISISVHLVDRWCND